MRVSSLEGNDQSEESFVFFLIWWAHAVRIIRLSAWHRTYSRFIQKSPFGPFSFHHSHFFFFWPNIPLVAPNIILTYSLEFLFIYLFLWRVFEYRSLKIGIACIILCRLWKKEKKFKKWRVGWTLFCPPFLAIFPLGLATSMGGILADSTFSTVWGRY